jgi:hypothetical protein
MTLQGIGAAFSTTVGGIVARRFGYPASFLALGVMAGVALLLWLATRPLMALACANHVASSASRNRRAAERHSAA